MGRASRRKRTKNSGGDRQRPDIAALRQSPGQYTADPSRSFESLVWAAAMHEAGHVVAAVALGFGVRFAVIRIRDDDREQGVDGYTEVTLDFTGGPFNSEALAVAASITPDALRVRAMQAYAGRVAESMINQDQKDLDRGSEDDENRVTAFAVRTLGSDVAESDANAYLNDRYNDAVRLLTPLALTIHRVANYLLEHANEEVPGDTLSGLVRADLAAAPPESSRSASD